MKRECVGVGRQDGGRVTSDRTRRRRARARARSCRHITDLDHPQPPSHIRAYSPCSPRSSGAHHRLFVPGLLQAVAPCSTARGRPAPTAHWRRRLCTPLRPPISASSARSPIPLPSPDDHPHLARLAHASRSSGTGRHRPTSASPSGHRARRRLPPRNPTGTATPT